LSRKAKAATAEALMRSRYTAFVKNDMEYLRLTLDPRRRSGFIPEHVADWNASVIWKGLRVLAVEKGGADRKETRGTVTFEAEYERAGSLEVLRATSRFKKKNGVWLYVDDVPETSAAPTPPKPDRNAPSPTSD
jgi:SEC-C motif-containing protein